MSLIDLAKAKAQADLEAEANKAENERKLWQSYQDDLNTLWNAVIDGLHEFHNEECNGGILQLVTGDSKLAVLKIVSGVQDRTILTIEGKIVSGTFDGSDDCRDIPYTEARVIISSPLERVQNFNGWASRSEYSEYARDFNKVEEVLKTTAAYLSKYFK